MSRTIPARNISLYDLESRFNLTAIEDPTFFLALQHELPEISESEQQTLSRIRKNFLNLNKRQPLLEDLVKMGVVSPLLDLAGFYEQNFTLKSEAEVEMVLEDEGEVIRGSIDILIVKERFWIMVIESKRTQIDVVSALPQTLFYLLNTPDSDQPTFGLVTNGREFVFIQFAKGDRTSQYTRSDALSIERELEFQAVFSILKHLAFLTN
jgi:hypothetical protein